jgi:Sulfotransferase family
MDLERPAGRARLLAELAEPGQQARQLPGIPSPVQPPVPHPSGAAERGLAMAADDDGDRLARHRRNLQLIGLPDRGRRWVLKSPSHLFALGALLRVYPDALVIQTHRAPRAAIASVCSLAAQASAGWSPAFTGEVIGRGQPELWARGLERFTAERARHNPARFCDVSYDEFVKHPIRTVEAIYARFGLRLSAAARDGMRALHARGGPAPARPAHRYALSDFGLTDDQVDERFGFR